NAVLNLADNNELIDSYIAAEDFDSPYYKSLYEAGKVKALNLGVDFTAEDFQAGLADGLRFFAENDGPYLVHCTEGKDRAGFVSALLSCLMGASYDEVVEDYMETYINYYHLEVGSEQYEAVKNSNIVSILENITSSEEGTDLTTVDLEAAALAYVQAIGLTDDEIAALKANLAMDYEIAAVEEPAVEEPVVEEPAVEEPAEEPVVTVAEPEIPSADTTYTVVSGDSLWKISSKLLGEGTRWGEIYDANTDTISNPSMIYVDQTLIIPAA
ncbi:MAG: tyrosine-protein phosphatase, partial [Clostridiales bacterium]|nr:tyrosine-protein phosphatase [Clostridiales bacterium]